MAELSGDKSQEPTVHRRQQARQQGQVARSQDLGSAGALVAGTLLLMTLGGCVVNFLGRLAERHLGGDAWLSADAGFVASQWRALVSALAAEVLPLFALLPIVAVACHVLQVGPLFLPGRLTPDLARVDPLRGAVRMVSLATGARLGFGLMKMAVVAAVACASLYQERDAILSLGALAPSQIGAFWARIGLATTLETACALLVLALVDYGFQWWRHEKDLGMSVEEVRQELKHLEGDPLVAARRRQVQRELALARLASSVRRAHVVIADQAELAIAVRYEAETMDAPAVVAKGTGAVARRTCRLAREHGIALVQQKSLAESLYREAEIHGPVPRERFAEVAAVLARAARLTARPTPAGSHE